MSENTVYPQHFLSRDMDFSVAVSEVLEALRMVEQARWWDNPVQVRVAVNKLGSAQKNLKAAQRRLEAFLKKNPQHLPPKAA